ncbi:MAG: UvrD-helicase domain-containing protein [Runella sp.]
MFKIVSSSAGSGKTYTLTKEYLKLVLQSSSDIYFKRILAITFTKAATREMKERILGRLESFYKGQNDPMLHDIIRELYPETQKDLEGAYRIREAELRQRSKRIFLKILHDYSDFAVLTIDSFVQRIVSAFTDELGIPFSFEVEMEADQLLLTAVERLLEKAGDEYADLTDILESFYLEMGQEGNNYLNLPENLASFAHDLLNEQHYGAIQKNRELSAKDFKKIRQQLISATKQWEHQITQRAKAGHQLLIDKGLTEKDFSNGTVFKYFNKRQQPQNAFEEPGKREREAFEENKGWLTKDKIKTPIEGIVESIKSELTDYYHFIEKVRATKGPLYLLYHQLIPRLYHLSLLNQIKEEFENQLRENNRVHISEFNQKILQIVTEDPVPFIYERLGEKFNHILIDEFQDTSKLQFANLLPLIDNSLGYDHFNLAVGDSKQAIYRFRGGDMDQIIALHSQKLDRLHHTLGESELTQERLENIRWHLQADALTTNRRSAREIIDFNNEFFQTIVNQYQEQFPMSRDVFAQVHQDLPPHPKTGGSVKIDFIENEKTEVENDAAPPAMVEKTLALVRQSIEQEGFSLGDIAILCRSKKNAQLIANALKDSGYNIISEDSLSLRFSGAVNLISAFMRVLVKPESKLDKYEALYLFFRVILQKIPDNQDNKHIQEAVESPDVRLFYSYVNGWLLKRQKAARQRVEATTPPQITPTPEAGELLQPYALLQMSAYELSEKLINVFRLFERAEERDYLFKFLDVVLEFITKRGSHLVDFLDYWEVQKEKISISTPSDPNAITVQTIHKSKGLEYPVVIIPYADWQFVPDAKSHRMWVTLSPSDEFSPTEETTQTSPHKQLKAGSVQMKSELEKTTDSIRKQYREECERVFVENLNLLYVAFTRPTQRLYVLAQQPSKNTKGEIDENSKKKISYWLWQYVAEGRGQQAVEVRLRAVGSRQQAEGMAHSQSEKRDLGVFKIISSDRSRELRLRRLANRVFDVETFERQKDHGNKVHYALSMIRTPQDLPAALIRLQTEGLIEKSEADAIADSLQRILQHPDLKGLFEIDSSILNEREILTPDGSIYRPDRVVIFPDKVVVMDYKTGMPFESHERQIKRYMNLYRQMGYKKVEGLLVYIERNEVQKIGIE